MAAKTPPPPPLLDVFFAAPLVFVGADRGLTALVLTQALVVREEDGAATLVFLIPFFDLF